MTENIRVFTYSLILDEFKTLKAQYQETGTISARLWPTKKMGQAEARKEALLLIAKPNETLKIHDRIICQKGTYRVLNLEIYPKHLEAILVKEEILQ